MPASRQPDPAIQRGIAHALSRAFNGSAGLPPAHIASEVAAAEFEALLAQLNNPPPQYCTEKANDRC